MISRLVIFGASGDLTSRYLVPALARLWQAGQLPEDFCVTGVGRRDADSTAFRQEMAEALDRFAAEVSPAARQAVCARLEYRRADSTKARGVKTTRNIAAGVFQGVPEGCAPAGPALKWRLNFLSSQHQFRPHSAGPCEGATGCP